MHRTKYAKYISKKFNLFSYKAVSTPLASSDKFSKEDGTAAVDGSIYRSLIGSLFYLTAIRLDLMYATYLLSRFMQSSSMLHFTTMKIIHRYIKGTIDFELMYMKHNNGELVGYSDNDWAGSPDDSKSTYGFYFHSIVLCFHGIRRSQVLWLNLL